MDDLTSRLTAEGVSAQAVANIRAGRWRLPLELLMAWCNDKTLAIASRGERRPVPLRGRADGYPSRGAEESRRNTRLGDRENFDCLRMRGEPLGVAFVPGLCPWLCPWPRPQRQ